jgi:hypothetical protein
MTSQSVWASTAAMIESRRKVIAVDLLIEISNF